ncbi:hypothetical protein XELAEV_18031476mg [Xenopus laevis]|uniref:Helix-turn-helix domain-containing protein n=1 Tax=Xenopus laevis TaxID=8355 RepID=A0A974HFQ2_XENLA|nr:hypothetical protein XELAEV_18031476mg [Xenopus laevis]
MHGNYDDTVNNYILEALEYLLTHNFFRFDSTFYLQKCGTSIGVKFPPTPTSLWGGGRRPFIFGGVSQNLSKVHFYKRHVDDLLFIWNGTEDEFNGFIKNLNTNDCNLVFTSTVYVKTICFLDLEMTHENEKVVSTVYLKESAGNSLLRADSCHPLHVFKAIPFGQFQRLHRNFSTEADFITKSLGLRDCFLERGYSLDSLKTVFVKALRQDRLALRSDNKGVGGRRSIDMPMFITLYSRQYPQVKKIINKYLPVLYGDESLRKVLQSGCKFVTRRAGTLGNMLAPSVIEMEGTRRTWLHTKGTYKCGSKRCVTCERMYISSGFVRSSTDRSFDIKSYINCNTKFVVYLLTCLKCEIQYVGCTTRSLKCRMREHIDQINSGSESTVASRHFLESSGSYITKLKIQGIENIESSVRGGDLTAKLFHRESFWIFTLGMRQPTGLSLKFDIACCV